MNSDVCSWKRISSYVTNTLAPLILLTGNVYDSFVTSHVYVFMLNAERLVILTICRLLLFVFALMCRMLLIINDWRNVFGVVDMRNTWFNTKNAYANSNSHPHLCFPFTFHVCSVETRSSTLFYIWCVSVQEIHRINLLLKKKICEFIVSHSVLFMYI